MLLTIVLLISAGVFYPHDTSAAPSSIKEVEKEREILNNELSKKEQEIGSVLDEIDGLYAEIAKTEAELAENEAKIADMEAKIMELEEEFYRLLDEINELNEKIAEREKVLAKRFSAYQEIGGDVTYLEVIFSAKSFDEFISRLTSLTTIANADKDLIEQQAADLEKVEQLQDDVLHKIKEQEKLIEEQEKVQASIESQKNALADSKNSLEKKEAALSKEIDALRSEDNELKNMEEKFRKRIEEAAQKKREQEAREQVATNDNGTENESNTTEEQTTASSSKQEASNNNETSPKQETSNQKQATKSKQTNSSKSNSDSQVNVGKTMQMEATAYGPDCSGCSGYTSTGIWVGGKDTPKIIAVDPSVIPLNTRVWVEGYGEAIAADTGGAIKGNRIDVLVKSEAYAASNWGRRTVTVKILD